MPSKLPKNYYDLLGIARNATEQDIKKAYRKKALLWHPDKAHQNKLSMEDATALFKELRLAFETLSNPEERIRYESSAELQLHTSSLFHAESDNALKIAIAAGDIAAVTALVGAGVPIHKFIMMHAIEKGTLEIIQYILMEKPHIHNPDNHFFRIPLAHQVILTGNVELLTYLEQYESLNIFLPSHTYDTPEKMKLSLIPFAVRSGSLAMISHLLDYERLRDAFTQAETSEDYSYEALKQAVRESNAQKGLFGQDRLKIIRFLIEDKHLCLSMDNWVKLIQKETNASNTQVKAYLQGYIDARARLELEERSSNERIRSAFLGVTAL